MIEDICLQTAAKLRDLSHVIEVSLREENVFMEGTLSPWDPSALDYGIPGLLVFFSEMELYFPGRGYSAVCHELMQPLAPFLEVAPTDFSLFSGFTGICFALQLLAQRDPRFSKQEESCRFLLTQWIENELLYPLERWGRRPGAAELDALTGLPSLIFYIRSYPEHRELFERMVRQLVRVVEHGYRETGLAHGVSGPLTALAQALLCGVEVPGQREAMGAIIRWLQQLREPRWPKRVAFNGFAPPEWNIFEGWAHGSPGILHALLQAAQALRDQELSRFCEEDLLRIPLEKSLPFCYGKSGVMSIIYNAGCLTGNERLKASAREIGKSIAASYRQEFPFGFKCLAPAKDKEDRMDIDNIGLLTGSMGIVLSLLWVNSSTKPHWPSLFLLN